MSIVKEIIALHHGTIDIDSSPDLGTTVRLCLPTYATLQDNANPTGQTRTELDATIQDTRPAAFN
jgi:hypothetical protein